MIEIDPCAIPCRVCKASPGRYCYVVTMLGPCEESILPEPHDQRVVDAVIVARIVGYSLRAVGPAR